MKKSEIGIPVPRKKKRKSEIGIPVPKMAGNWKTEIGKRKSEKLIIFLSVFFQVFLILLIDFVDIIQDGNFLGNF